jgi:hypothetical protein
VGVLSNEMTSEFPIQKILSKFYEVVLRVTCDQVDGVTVGEIIIPLQEHDN